MGGEIRENGRRNKGEWEEKALRMGGDHAQTPVIPRNGRYAFFTFVLVTEIRPLHDLKLIPWLEERLRQPLPGHAAHERMLARVRAMPAAIPEGARPSAVLSLIFPEDNELKLLLIKRTEDGRAHSGQISFPGGRQEETDADLRATALREAQEEVGIMSAEVSVVGQLTPLYIPVSNFLVYPFVAFAKEKPCYNISRHEVADILEVPLSELLMEERKTIARVTSPADRTFVRDVNAYRLSDGAIIWGATAMIISELEVILSETWHS